MYKKTYGNSDIYSTSEDRGKRSTQSIRPGVSLPKSGGAIRGIDEIFSTNPLTGVGAISFPITTSSGHNGFGWAIHMPLNTLKTSIELPHYNDTQKSDVFFLSGVEDIGPVFIQNQDGR